MKETFLRRLYFGAVGLFLAMPLVVVAVLFLAPAVLQPYQVGVLTAIAIMGSSGCRGCRAPSCRTRPWPPSG